MNFAFESVHDFMVMGHHGVYVWSAWLISGVAILLLIMQSKRARRRFYHQEHARLRRITTQTPNTKQSMPEQSE